MIFRCRIVIVLTLALVCVQFTSLSSFSACDAKPAKWQADYSVFLARLHALAEHGETPTIKMLEAKKDSFLISDGAGGWVDRSAAKGTIQHQVNELCHGKKVTWDVVLFLGLDPITFDPPSPFLAGLDRIIAIVPTPPKASKKQKHATVLWISFPESKLPKELKFKQGSKIRLEGVLGDARGSTRSLFTGVNAVYHNQYDDEEPHTSFIIGFDKVSIRPIPNSVE